MRSIIAVAAFAGFALLCPTVASAQSAADSAAIRATALDYIDGWYAADGARMERALHPELAKRMVYSDANGRSRLIQMSAMTLVNGTKGGGGSDIPAAQRSDSVKILDIFGNTASVRVRAATWVDYMHIAKYNGQWRIINVLWENDPPKR
ncbi:MAG TPA: nuclear transport factor 2 family protein [Dongiaceae bacterium]